MSLISKVFAPDRIIGRDSPCFAAIQKSDLSGGYICTLEVCTAFLEVRIFRDNREALTAGILPDGFIIRASQSARMNMDRSGEFTLQHVRQTRRQILVKQQLHAFCNSSLRSRSAA